MLLVNVSPFIGFLYCLIRSRMKIRNIRDSHTRQKMALFMIIHVIGHHHPEVVDRLLISWAPSTYMMRGSPTAALWWAVEFCMVPQNIDEFSFHTLSHANWLTTDHVRVTGSSPIAAMRRRVEVAGFEAGDSACDAEGCQCIASVTHTYSEHDR